MIQLQFLGITLITLVLVSCQIENSKTSDNTVIERYIERQFPFTDLFCYRVRDNAWIRKPENILAVHETLERLIEISLDLGELTQAKSLEHFNYFKSMDMHQSAYNLLYENMFYANLELNRDSLKDLLKTERVDYDTGTSRTVFLVDNTK